VADVFISYARETEITAKKVADALRAGGFSVWYDEDLPAHRAFSEVIEERLREAKAAIVIWSAEAAKSQWVRAEANAAREAGTIVQLRVDKTELPLPFREIQCVDLSVGRAGRTHPVGARSSRALKSSSAKKRLNPFRTGRGRSDARHGCACRYGHGQWQQR
jgi:adenylate cyclase